MLHLKPLAFLQVCAENSPASIHRLSVSSTGSPIQNFQLDGATAVELVDLRLKRQIEPTDWQRGFTVPPPNRFTDGRAVAHPHFDMLFLHAHAPERTRMGKISRAKLDRYVALPAGLQPFHFGQGLNIDFLQSHFRVQAQRRLQILRSERSPRQFIQFRRATARFCPAARSSPRPSRARRGAATIRGIRPRRRPNQIPRCCGPNPASRRSRRR